MPRALTARVRLDDACQALVSGSRSQAATELHGAFFVDALGQPPPPLTSYSPAFVRYLAAVELTRLGEHEAALKDLRQIATDRNETPSSRLEAAQALAALGQLDLASELLREMAMDVDTASDVRLEAEIDLLKCGLPLAGPAADM